MSCQTLVVAHDGSDQSTPHTLEYVLHALKAGADIVEVDIRTTKDGVVVLQHDAEIAVDGERLRIIETTFADLDELQRAGKLMGRTAAGRITRLSDILGAAGAHQAVFNLDVKEDAVIDPAVSILKRNDMVDRAIFSGCEFLRARSLKSRHRNCQVLLNISDAQYQQVSEDPGSFIHSVCSDAAEASCCGVNVRSTHCTRELIAYAGLRFLPVSVWTVDDPESMKHFLHLGVYSITTNCVARLRQLRTAASRSVRGNEPQFR